MGCCIRHRYHWSECDFRSVSLGLQLLQKLRSGVVGAFLVGIIVPREGGLAITLTEKLEDKVSIVFLPLVRVVIVLHYNLAHFFCQYFTISGLNTNLGLLNNGSW